MICLTPTPRAFEGKVGVDHWTKNEKKGFLTTVATVIKKDTHNVNKKAR